MSKKSFKDNPALQFMSRPEVVSREATAEREPEIKVPDTRDMRDVRNAGNNFRAMPVVFEAKSKRFNMLIRPSVYASLREMSINKGTSVNDLINTIVENYIENQGK